jgi:hypothetical protein
MNLSCKNYKDVESKGVSVQLEFEPWRHSIRHNENRLLNTFSGHLACPCRILSAIFRRFWTLEKWLYIKPEREGLEKIILILNMLGGIDYSGSLTLMFSSISAQNGPKNRFTTTPLVPPPLD